MVLGGVYVMPCRLMDEIHKWISQTKEIDMFIGIIAREASFA